MKDDGAVGFLRDLISGGVSGIAAKTVAAPLERVKLILQTQHVNKDVRQQYKGTADCFRRVYQEQGLASFWRGHGANVVRYFPAQALSFAFKDLFKDAIGIGSTAAIGQFWSFLCGNIAAAGAAGGTSMLLLYPFELARTRLAADVAAFGAPRRFLGICHCLTQIHRVHGVVGLYAGLPVSLVGVVVFRGLHLGCYDVAKSFLNIRRSDSKLYFYTDLISRLGCAQLVTTVAGTVCFPLDTIRRRMMMQAREDVAPQFAPQFNLKSGKQPKVYYRNSFHCFARILQEEGIRGLFAGLTANLFRGIAGSLMLVGYDECKRFFGDKAS